jgi:hypothetical protein
MDEHVRRWHVYFYRYQRGASCEACHWLAWAVEDSEAAAKLEAAKAEAEGYTTKIHYGYW